MNIGQSVRKAIDDWEHSELEAAMLHACNAVNGTAKKVYPLLHNERFTRLLRANYGILGPMGAPELTWSRLDFRCLSRSPRLRVENQT
jgi:hypothetical protein